MSIKDEDIKRIVVEMFLNRDIRLHVNYDRDEHQFEFEVEVCYKDSNGQNREVMIPQATVKT